MAWAVAITQENLSAIASEAGRKFDREHLNWWFDNFKSGYFLRDEGSPLDCELFVEAKFFESYSFKFSDAGALFREVVKN